MGELGWSRERLAGAAPDLVEAVRWQIYAKALWPAATVRAIEADDLPKDPKRAEAARNAQLMAAREYVRWCRDVLFPDDEPAEALS